LSAICIPLFYRGDKLHIRTGFLPSFIELSDLKWPSKDLTPVSVRGWGCLADLFLCVPSRGSGRRTECKINEVEKKYGRKRNDKRMEKVDSRKGLGESTAKGIHVED
jgi:hypothetical protein